MIVIDLLETLAKNVNLERFTSYEEIFHLSPSAVEGILKTVKLPTSYAYEYDDWSNISELYNDSNNLQIYTSCDWDLAYRYFVKARLI